MRTKIYDAYCSQVGTERQHRYACVLARKAGYDALRYAVADALDISISKAGRKGISPRDASQVIDYLQGKLNEQQEQEEA